MTRDTVHLFLRGGRWYVRYGGPHRLNGVALFGADELETVYAADADPAALRQRVQDLHPQALIVLEATPATLDGAL